jgi:hypothetical protein
MWFFAFPLYAGNGQSILNRKSVIDLNKENAQKQNELKLAKDLQERAAEETAAYEAIDTDLKEKINKMIFTTVDIPRLFNDISILVKNSGLKMGAISYSKTSAPDGLNQLNSYKISLSVSGDYLKFREFMKSMQNSLQLYRISSIFFTSVKSTDTRNTQDPSGISGGQKFNIVFDVYEFKN